MDSKRANTHTHATWVSDLLLNLLPELLLMHGAPLIRPELEGLRLSELRVIMLGNKLLGEIRHGLRLIVE
jgi:hypothetical protein